MTYIYSNDEVVGVSGAYVAPHLFDGVISGAKTVYTDDEKIAKVYEAVNVEVLPIKQKQTRQKS